MRDILRHLETGCGKSFATFTPDVGILRHLHTGCGTLFATYTPAVGYSSPPNTGCGIFVTTHTHTGSGTFLTTYTPAEGHSSPHRLWDILHHIHTGCRIFTTHVPTHPHTHTGCETKPIDKQDDSGGIVNTVGHDRVGHCEKNCPYKHASNSEWLPRYEDVNGNK
jgi:hypothetical protein